MLRRELAAGYDWWATVMRLVGRERDTLAPALSLRRSALGVRARSLTAGRVLRLDLHPADFDRPRRVLALEAVLRGASGRRAVTYDELAPAPFAPAGRRGSDVSVKLLVVTPEPVDADRLRDTVGPEVEGAEVLVVSPATNQSRLAFWVSDSDEAIAEAEQAEERTVESLESAGVEASGDTGESEPARRRPGRAGDVRRGPDRDLRAPRRTTATRARTRASRTSRSGSGSRSRGP